MPGESLSLSALLDRVGKALEESFPRPYWIMAEILELRVNTRGHCYMELIEKHPDDESIMARARATIWASRYSMLRPFFESTTGMPLKSGIKILCRGSVRFHAQYGFSIQVTDIDPAFTLGDLARKKQEVIERLRGEGVMEMNRELPLPAVPQRVAVISSETAAGYGDFMETMEGNSHGFRFATRLFPAIMQGDEAPASIMGALDAVFREAGTFDCVALIRGGGSKADLECFNNYDLAYYITQFPLPVLTGIGHERDESVTDLVAALGLKTPTAVAEYLVDRLLAFDFRLTSYGETLSMLVNRTIQDRRLLLERQAGALSHLSRGFLQQKLASLEKRTIDLSHRTRAFLVKEREMLGRSALLLRKGTNTMISRKKDHLALLKARNDLVNPENILKRGYSITLSGGRIIRDTRNVMPGDMMETRLHEGSILSKVEKTTSPHGKGKDKLR